MSCRTVTQQYFKCLGVRYHGYPCTRTRGRRVERSRTDKNVDRVPLEAVPFAARRLEVHVSVLEAAGCESSAVAAIHGRVLPGS